MMRRYLVVIVIMLMAGSIRAEDWPRYRGPEGNGVSKETGLLKAWPAGGPKLLWSAPLGIGYSSVAVAAGRVFTMYQDGQGQWVAAFNEKSGDLLWKTQTGPIYRDREGWHGTRATPTVEGERVWVNDSNGIAACLNVADGKVVWKKNILEIAGNTVPRDKWWGMAQSPFVYRDLVVFNPGGDKGAAFLALNKNTGAVAWKSGNDFPGYSTPVISRAGGVEHLVFVDGTDLVGIRPADGKILWTAPWGSMNHLNAVSPIAWDDKVFISGGYVHGAMVVQLDMKNEANPARELWTTRAMQCYFHTPIKLGDCIYGYRMDDMVCIDTAGSLKWEDDNDDMPKMAQMTFADGLFYVLGEDGTLALAQLTPAGCKKISEFVFSEGESRWAAPVVANGRLFLRDEKKLYCYDVKALK